MKTVESTENARYGEGTLTTNLHQNGVLKSGLEFYVNPTKFQIPHSPLSHIH